MQTTPPFQFCRSRSSTQFHSSITPLCEHICTGRGPSALAMELAFPKTPQVRNHHKIHQRKADQAGQEALLHDTAHQPLRIQLADQQLSNPKIATFTEKDVRAKRLSASLRRNTAINQQTTHNRLIRSGRQQEASREWMETLHPWGKPSPQGPASNRERSHRNVGGCESAGKGLTHQPWLQASKA